MVLQWMVLKDKRMDIIINCKTKIVSEFSSKAVEWAAKSLKRDLLKVCGQSKEPLTAGNIIIRKGNQEKECFLVCTKDEDLVIFAGDELGAVYGIYHISREILGISDFWFWNDQKITIKEEYLVDLNYRYQSTPFTVKLRGWFVNDEVLLHIWMVNRRAQEPWEMVFETLLRLGGNMVIPGTDRNSEKYRSLASQMGLAITHHHAEPLGAPMFARVFPELNPSYEEHSEKFKSLWAQGIQEQKDMHVVWNLGFRGQGDCPFWENDPRYQTQEARGQLMSRLIEIQYRMVKEQDPDAICCTNLYGETMELYRDGYLKLPEDIIKIWADNGFGKMVTRRQENHNPRISALPKKGDQGRHGIYYHVSFYDLQAANHMTMLPNDPEFVLSELREVLERGVHDYWIINCSNVKPHIYYLDFISKIWKHGTIHIADHRMQYSQIYYGKENAKIVSNGIEKYFYYAQAYGEHEDEHAGEQFSNHVARMLVSQFMKDRNQRAENLLWASNNLTLKGQTEWYEERCHQAQEKYRKYLELCERLLLDLSERGRELWEDSLLLQARIHYHCFYGAYFVCKSILKAFEENYQKAFYYAGLAREAYLKANQSMRDREHGKWHNFYANECLTDIKQSAWVLEGFMSFLRNIGDGPHFYHWQREFLYSEEDKRVMLILNMENHRNDQEIFSLMKEKWEAIEINR